jgi:hypothetical protein
MDEQTETRKRAPRGSKVVFRRERKDGPEYPGYYVRWVDAAGTRHQAFGGRTHSAAQVFLRAKQDERDRHLLSGEPPVMLAAAPGALVVLALLPVSLWHCGRLASFLVVS